MPASTRSARKRSASAASRDEEDPAATIPRGAPADQPSDDGEAIEEATTPVAVPASSSRSTRASTNSRQQRATRSKKKSELRKHTMGVGLSIGGGGGGSGGASGARQNKKITFDSDDEAQDVLDGEEAPKDSNNKDEKAKGGAFDEDDEDDDDVIEEVKSGTARADALRQMQAEREQKKKQAEDKKKKKKNRSKRKAEAEAKEVVPPSDDEVDQGDKQESDSDDGDDDDELDEEFLAMVDSERQTELKLQKLRKKAEKRRKLQAEKKIGRHTTFVSDGGDGALIGEDAIGQSIQAEHGIEVVVLPSVKRGASGDGSDESGSEDEGYGRVDVSAVLGTKPSKAAILLSRGQVECGDVSRKGNKKVRRSKKGGNNKGSRGGKDQGWTRSRKATNMSVARGRIGGPAANFAVNKRKKLA